jgi:hypothetical protein
VENVENVKGNGGPEVQLKMWKKVHHLSDDSNGVGAGLWITQSGFSSTLMWFTACYGMGIERRGACNHSHAHRKCICTGPIVFFSYSLWKYWIVESANKFTFFHEMCNTRPEK